MTTIAYIIMKFESMIKNPIVTNHALFAAATFSKKKLVPYINYIIIQNL